MKNAPRSGRIFRFNQRCTEMTTPNQKPELLAPAGSLESFFAALEKGADAVYAGLNMFSARARAKNFTLAQMERMLGYAHAHDRSIYITLNTLVKENELPQLGIDFSSCSCLLPLPSAPICSYSCLLLLPSASYFFVAVSVPVLSLP